MKDGVRLELQTIRMWEEMQFLGYLNRQEQGMRNTVDCIRARESAGEEQV